MTDRELLEKANKSYREGSPIMGDAEYDELEAKLGLENSNMIGEKHSPEMTIKHPFIMGSLSKIQVHASKDGTIEWDSILKDLYGYIGDKEVIITPKYDGCSFEAYFKNGECVSVSTRGDGNWGRDISKHIYNKIPEAYKKLPEEYAPEGTYTLRGEILVKKDVFGNRWKGEYANTRAFVAGVTGQDYDPDDYKLLQKLNDLSIVIYDFRTKHDIPFNDGWYDEGWRCLPKSNVLPKFYIKKRICDDRTYNEVYDGVTVFEDIYNKFDEYRKKCEYSLDGFVIKPIDRVQDFTNARPKDCVAIKFLPMVADTEVTRIEWSLGKTGEYFPIVYYKPVYMDGKECTKASGHNYGTLVEKGIAPGAKVTISMAGDIIPYIYKVVSPVYDVIVVPDSTYVDDCHLMKSMTDDERRIEEFRNSCKTLEIPGLGDEMINKLIDAVKIDNEPDEFFGEEKKDFPMTVFAITPAMMESYIGGKNGKKLAKAFQDIISNISLDMVIRTMNIRFCGKALSKEVARYLCGQPHDFSGMAQEGWAWSIDDTSDEYMKLDSILKMLGKDLTYFMTMAEQTANPDMPMQAKTKIIMTGEPNGYATKGEFLKAHPEYEETSSWKNVQIVFTNSLESNTGKMKKAREKGIEIRTY